MEFDQKQYFRELGDATVDGFTIIEHNGIDEYRIVEQWERDDDPIWADYIVEEETLLERIENGTVEPVGQISDEQFDQLCEKADLSFETQ